MNREGNQLSNYQILYHCKNRGLSLSWQQARKQSVPVQKQENITKFNVYFERTSFFLFLQSKIEG